MTNNSDLKTGDLVLCKVGSFPPWPAVVFPQRYLRNDVYKKRKASRVAVCFFNDPTYYWEQPQKLKELTPTVIKSYLKESNKSGAPPDLITAYREAKNFTNLNDFIIARFTDEGRLSELENQDQDIIPQGEDPFLSKVHQRSRKLNSKLESGSENTSDNSSTVESRTETDNKKRKSKSTDMSLVAKRLKAEDSVPDNNTSASSRSAKSNSSSSSTTKKKAKLDSSRNIEICLLFRRKIQKNLIQRDTVPTQVGLEETHKLLDKIEENLNNKPLFFDIDSLRQSKLHKLLKVIINDNNLSEFHDVSRRILLSWTDIIHQLKLEKLAESSTVESTNKRES